MSKPTVPQVLGHTHVLQREMPKPVMAKAQLPEQDGREKYGRVLRRASALANLNRRETADALGVDEAQLGRWWSGLENAQVWRYHAHAVMSAALLVAQAEATGSAVVRTAIEVRLLA